MDAPIYRLENVLHDARDADCTQQDFIGPLDLILHLLSKNKLEIQDISVAQIVDQYLNWVAKRRRMDLEVASEFVAMAAQLLYLKSRMLLSSQDEEALSEMELLLASLEERQRGEHYQRIRLLVPLLQTRYEQGHAYIPKLPQALPARRRVYAHKRADLLFAMERILSRSKERLPPSPKQFYEIVRQEPYPVETKSAQLLARLRQGETLTLRALWKENRSRSELVASFLAVLELCRAGQVEFLGEDAESAALRLGSRAAGHSA